ncbi:adhesion G protein-coupled receptor F5-like [Mastacembelus armatus]|uniref:adhesion G protein-coupled receptor F5-like n=1 Tax=Mastacembelus armatus TaxID=205130 RepID=UPI000E4643E8|nr:adhesion G protein-coupled receptor F5-like [Mastacembelus armatus]
MSNKSLTTFALAVAVTLLIVETANLIEFSNPDLPERDEEEFLPHTRQKRNAPALTSQNTTVSSSTSEATTIMTRMVNNTVPTMNSTTAIATIPTMSTTTANTTIPTTDTTAINATIPTMSTTTANTTIPTTDTTAIDATIPTMSTTTANTTIPATDTTTIDATIPTMSTTTANTTIPTTDTTAIDATIPTMSTTKANTTIPTTDTTAIDATIPTMSTTTANTTIPTTDTTAIDATIPTMSTTKANTTIPTTDTTAIDATIPTMSTTMANTTIPTTDTTAINATFPTMSTTTANTTIPTTDTTAINATFPTMSTTTANTTIPTTDTTAINATFPTMSTTTANTTIPTMSTTMVNTTIPTTVTTIASTANSTMTMADTTAPINSTTTASTIVANTMTTASTTVSTTTANTTVSTITTVASTTVPITTTTTTTTNIGTSDTTASTVSTTTVTSTTSTAPTVFGVDMSITLDKEYTEGLNDITSPEFKNLTSSIQPVLERQYKGITGFKRVVVKGFRKGSVITDFVIETTQVNSNEIAEANLKLPEAMKPIAPVIGSVSAVYISAYPISIPDLTYTGSSMTLTCGPPPKDFNVGQISGSVWKFNGLEIKDGGRIKITTTTNTSVLIVNNVINADVGLYECTLRGTVIDFLQNGTVRENQIKQAPIVQLQSQINIQCKEGQIQPLECCVQQPYTVQWLQGTTVLISDPTNGTENYCIKYNYRIESCSTSQDKTSFICRVIQPQGYEMTMTLTIFNSAIQCNDTQYGVGRADDMSVIGCDKGQEGNKTAICQETGEWRLVRDTCIITTIKELLTESQNLQVEKVPEFVVNLTQTVQQDETKVINSSTTISAIVGILNNIANVSTEVNATVMQDVLNTVDVIIGDGATQSWAFLNANESLNTSSELLGSMATLSDRLVGEFANSTQRILLNRTMFNNSFHADLNSSIIIDIPNTGITNTFITTITFSTLNNVMPVRNSTFNATNNGTAINAAVVLVKINATIQNVTFSYNKVNKSLTLNPQCVFWNFTLLQNLGAWDDTGCEFVSDINNTVTCRCNHLTSFSLLMATDIPPSLREALDIITYVGVGISLASLVICLIIEGYVWKAVARNSTAFMRHVSIVNTALSLLIADICFIIAAAIANNPLENQGKDLTLPVGPCSTATFFMHFFYLALFFWMLVSGLLLFYRTVMVFSHMSKSTMLAIGFSLGYGCPLIIAAITVAVTAPGHGYVRKTDGCWLNWSETKALLALVIPALTIVLINMLIVIVVLFKMLRRGVGDITQRDERHTLVVVARCVIILTPLFGLTWSLGVGTMVSSTDKGIHIAFAFFNSLQGFSILVFGTLFDSKIRSVLLRSSASSSQRSSSSSSSSFSGINLINRLRGRRYVYHLSTATSTSSAESFFSKSI